MTIDSKIQSIDFDAEASIKSDGMQLGHGQGTVDSERRRRLAKLGFGVPVLMTLASRPVLAGQCLSNMMSGNLSDPTRGQCAKGWSPGGWSGPGGFPTPNTWSMIGLLYGNLTTGALPNKFESYTGGATLQNVPAILNKNNLPTNTFLRVVLRDPNTPGLDPVVASANLTRHFLCAYLNAKYGELSGDSFMYILKSQQVLDLAGGLAIPAGAAGAPSNYNTFFDSTWV